MSIWLSRQWNPWDFLIRILLNRIKILLISRNLSRSKCSEFYLQLRGKKLQQTGGKIGLSNRVLRMEFFNIQNCGLVQIFENSLVMQHSKRNKYFFFRSLNQFLFLRPRMDWSCDWHLNMRLNFPERVKCIHRLLLPLTKLAAGKRW